MRAKRRSRTSRAGNNDVWVFRGSGNRSNPSIVVLYKQYEYGLQGIKQGYKTYLKDRTEIQRFSHLYGLNVTKGRVHR